MAGRVTDVVRSVTLLYKRVGEGSPLRHTVDLLGLPRRTDASAPHSDFIRQWCRTERLHGYTIEVSSAAERFVSENAQWAKKLELYVWTIKQMREGMHTAMHYAFLLRVVDM